jgi:uncharacterized protein YcbK (DUF882 family)
VLSDEVTVRTFIAAIFACCASMSLSADLMPSPRVQHTQGLATKKGAGLGGGTSGESVVATLVQTHTDERVVLDADQPTLARFSGLLADRVTGSKRDLDGRLLEMLRTLAGDHRGARVELVSGYRSPKLNELLRKKGHHVASRSQHSLGCAVDFRIVDPETLEIMDPRAVAAEVRGHGWVGGVGTYLGKKDRFVHIDVGPLRKWSG